MQIFSKSCRRKDNEITKYCSENLEFMDENWKLIHNYPASSFYDKILLDTDFIWFKEIFFIKEANFPKLP